MKRHVLAALAASLAAALVPSLALAKGPIEATIDGPGLGSPLTFSGAGEAAMSSGQPQMRLAEAAGFFPAAFRQVPDPMLARRPAGALGPRYVIQWRIPGPEGTEYRIVQDLYPYAKPGPVTYMEPGQPFFETPGTRGGWFAAPTLLTSILTEAGLPGNPPTGGGGSELPWTLVGALAGLAAAIGLAAWTVVAIRRRPHPAT